MGAKAQLAVWKFASCDGCQLTLLDCEDELLNLCEHLEIAYFLEASKKQMKGPYDLSLVEGSITTPEDEKRIQTVRQLSKTVICIGACATSGGIQALRNSQNIQEFIQYVYPHPEYISTLKTSTPISDHIKVDYELRGCPINKTQLLEVCRSFLMNKPPNVPHTSVCVECKMQGNACILVTQGVPCMGPITHGGCGALCPSYHRGCYGCYGPKETPNSHALAQYFEKELNIENTQIVHLLRNYNNQAPSFKEAAERYEHNEAKHE